MKVTDVFIEGLKIIEPKIFYDERGYFFESYSELAFNNSIGQVSFVQDNESMSSRGVARGLHFQAPPSAQAKLVRCVKGEVLDIALDIRKGSETYGKFFSVLLSGEKHNQFYIPRGFAHGFIVISDIAVFQYKCDNAYNPGSEGGISILDTEIGIDKLVRYGDLILSEKDKKYPLLRNFESPFILGVNC